MCWCCWRWKECKSAKNAFRVDVTLVSPHDFGRVCSNFLGPLQSLFFRHCPLSTRLYTEACNLRLRYEGHNAGSRIIVRRCSSLLHTKAANGLIAEGCRVVEAEEREDHFSWKIAARTEGQHLVRLVEIGRRSLERADGFAEVVDWSKNANWEWSSDKCSRHRRSAIAALCCARYSRPSFYLCPLSSPLYTEARNPRPRYRDTDNDRSRTLVQCYPSLPHTKAHDGLFAEDGHAMEVEERGGPFCCRWRFAINCTWR